MTRFAEVQRDRRAVTAEPIGRPPLRLVDPTHPEEVDNGQQRLAFMRRCESIAADLAASTLEERLAAYRAGEYTRRELSTATALRPDLMPVLNGEWEWIAVNAE